MTTTTTSTYIPSNEITNLRSTLCTMVSQLMNQEMYNNPDGHNQVVLQLNPEANGDQWLMFVYFDKKSERFYFSFQDQDCNDTDFTYGYGFMDMIEQIEREIEKVDGFEWIESDFD